MHWLNTDRGSSVFIHTTFKNGCTGSQDKTIKRGWFNYLYATKTFGKDGFSYTPYIPGRREYFPGPLKKATLLTGFREHNFDREFLQQ